MVVARPRAAVAAVVDERRGGGRSQTMGSLAGAGACEVRNDAMNSAANTSSRLLLLDASMPARELLLCNTNSMSRRTVGRRRRLDGQRGHVVQRRDDRVDFAQLRFQLFAHL